MSIKFIYRRYITQPTEGDVELGKTYSLSCTGGVTVGYIWDKACNKIKLAVARCKVEENFNRRVARDIVTGRVQSKKVGRNHEIDLSTVPNIQNYTPQQIEDVVWGWLENQERLWDADIQSYSVH